MVLIPSNHVFSQVSFIKVTCPTRKSTCPRLAERWDFFFSSAVCNRTNRATLSFCLPHRMLLEADADLNHVTSNGTSLHEAALYGKTEVVKTLLEVKSALCKSLS